VIRRITTAGLTATLVAGIVGVLRQRAEAQAVRRGELTPASAATEVPPRAHYGPLADRASTWVPTAPGSPVARLAAVVWSAPMSAVGLVLALTGGRRPRWDTDRRCWVTAGVRGPSAVALRAVGADANAVGQVVLSHQAHPAKVLLDHEAVHVRQAERLGPLLLPVYVWFGARYGYRDHPLERAARRGAREARERRDVSSRDAV
jgi:hypothetical protein